MYNQCIRCSSYLYNVTWNTEHFNCKQELTTLQRPIQTLILFDQLNSLYRKTTIVINCLRRYLIYSTIIYHIPILIGYYVPLMYTDILILYNFIL